MDHFLSGSLIRNPFQRDKALAVVREKHFPEKRARESTTIVFTRSIVTQFDGIIDSQLNVAGIDDISIAQILNVHKGTLSRWRKKQQVPSREHKFLCVAACDLQVHAALPRGRILTISALCDSLYHLDEQFLRRRRPAAAMRKGDSQAISRHDFVVLHYAANSLSWLNALSLHHERATSAKTRLASAAETIIAKACNEDRRPANYGSLSSSSDEAIERVVEITTRWAIAYYVAMAFIPYNWTYEKATDERLK